MQLYSGGPNNCWRKTITLETKHKAAIKIQHMWVSLRGNRTLSRALAELRVRRAIELRKEEEQRQREFKELELKRDEDSILAKEEGERYARGEIRDTVDATFVHFVRTSEGKECVANLRRWKVLEQPLRDTAWREALCLCAKRHDVCLAQELIQALISTKPREQIEHLLRLRGPGDTRNAWEIAAAGDPGGVLNVFHKVTAGR